MIGLIEAIVKPLVDYPEDVTVAESKSNTSITYRLTVHPEDVGKVIGKQGRVAKAIRAVVYAAGHQQNEKFTLEIQ